jgi:hypothetical protein
MSYRKSRQLYSEVQTSPARFEVTTNGSGFFLIESVPK